MTANDYRLLGKRISAVREKAGLKQHQLAEKIGKGPKFLSDIERGVKRPSLGTLFALAKSLNIPPAVFFKFEREETESQVLRDSIASMLSKSDPEELRLVHRVVKAITEA